MTTLQTERLLLRDFKPDDFDEFYATTEAPEYRRFYSEQEMTREFWQGIYDRIIGSIEVEDRLMYQLAICLQTGGVIGTCGVRIEDVENRQASFGCAIAKPYWGAGLASEASRRILDFAFDGLPIHRIYAETNSENTRSRAMAEGLGMHLDGELRQNRFFRGRWWDTAIYSILKHEWQTDA